MATPTEDLLPNMDTRQPEMEALKAASDPVGAVAEENGAENSSSSQKDSSMPYRSRSSSPVLFIGPIANPSTAVVLGAKDVTDPLAVHGSCGLNNLGNTCFMNAGIQALASCAPLLKFFFEDFHLQANQRGTLTGAFYMLLCKMWSGQYSVVHPQQFKELLGLYHPQFQDYRQHDCQEFLALLLDTFHEQLNMLPCVAVANAGADMQTPDQLNNQDHSLESGLSPGKVEPAPEPKASLEIVIDTGHCGKEVDEISVISHDEISTEAAQLLGSCLVEVTHSRNSLKRISSSPADAMATALVSEDSNHSSVSVQSTDSEQTSAFKKLKIEPETSGANSGGLVNSRERVRSVLDHDSEAIQTTPQLTPVSSGEVSKSPDAGSSDEPMEFSQETDSARGLAQTPCSSGLKDAAVDSMDNFELSPNQADSSTSRVSSNLSGQSDLPSRIRQTTAPMSSPPSSPHQTLKQSVSQDSSQPLACLEDYYCKETKTLNTNVLVSCYTHRDVSMDSEKFAKIDNRSQMPVTKEVNLLQEALQDIDSDKVDKALIGKTLGGKSSNVNSASPASKTTSPSSNLRMVKTQNTTVLRKASLDSHLLNNSYEYEEDVLAYDGLVPAAFQKGVEESGVLGVDCGKPEASDIPVAAKMMEIPAELKPSEVEKNVQMQAFSKFKTAMTKSNIREDISDKASTSESTETDEADMEVEVESSEDEKDEEEEETALKEGAMEGNPGLLNPARCYTAADISAANASWESYKARNNSVVVSTFQGQFKSTVVCSECDHVSVTYEPFMYLSLPIPHAMERQICVVFIRLFAPVTRYMVTLHKNDKVQRLRQELQTLTSTDTSDVILAEVLDKHISRLLDDNIMLRYINDTSREIFAFEMLPPPDIPQGRLSPMELSPSLPPVSSSSTRSIPSKKPAETCTSQCAELGGLSRPLTIDTGRVPSASATCQESKTSPLLSMQELDDMLSGAPEHSCNTSVQAAATITSQSQVSSQQADPFLPGTGLLEWTKNQELSNSSLIPEVSPPPCSPLSEHSLPYPGDLAAKAYCEGGEGASHSPLSSAGLQHLPMGPRGSPSQAWPGEAGDPGPSASPRASGLMDQWQMCAICLEEMVDSDLLTHMSCSGIFCHTCLEMSAKHSGDLAHCCPICLSPVDGPQDFVPLAGTSTVKCKLRILALPVTFRCKEEEYREGEAGSRLQLICGPRLLYMASQQDAHTLYTFIDKLSPFHGTYTLHFTDGQGLSCSRCQYGAHCTGCEIPRAGDITFQPGDNLTLHFEDPPPEHEVNKANQVSEDPSLKKLRGRDRISIFDCFDAFTQSEVLDEHNPWYCPCCCRNQCARKTMTVWRYPDSLIIHLKRFVYEDLTSTKIDNRVVFPHTNFDVSRFLAGPPMSFNIYDLHSIVCHYGGANSGHYTSFTCHPLTNEWYNYNDETVTPQKPGENEYSSGYVLFYRRQGLKVEFSLIKELPFTTEEEEEETKQTSSGAPACLLASQPSPASPVSASVSTTITLDMDSLPLSGGIACKSSEADTNDNSYDFYN